MKIVPRIVETVKSSPYTKHLESNYKNPDIEEFQNSKRVKNSFRERKGNSANIARGIERSMVGKASNISVRFNCQRLGVSFWTSKRAISDTNSLDNPRFITLISYSREKTVLTEETKMVITKFYNVAPECLYRKSTVLVYGQKQLVKFLEKTLKHCYQQFKL